MEMISLLREEALERWQIESRRDITGLRHSFFNVQSVHCAGYQATLLD